MPKTIVEKVLTWVTSDPENKEWEKPAPWAKDAPQAALKSTGDEVLVECRDYLRKIAFWAKFFGIISIIVFILAFFAFMGNLHNMH